MPVLGGTSTAAVTHPLGYIDLKTDYSAKVDAKLVTDAAITSGQATLTSASAGFTSADIGKTVIAYGAGTSGATLTTTINNVSGGVATLAANAGTTIASGGSVLYGTDDTAAWQAAINAANTQPGGATIYFDGWSIIGGAQVTGSVTGTGWTYNYSGQLLFPARSVNASGKVTIRLLGASPAPLVWWASTFTGSDEELSPGRSAIFSTATSGNVFDAIPHTSGQGHASNDSPMTDIDARLENWTLLVPVQPTCNGFNGYVLASMGTDGFSVGPHAPSGKKMTLRPSGTAIAIITPREGNSAYVDLRRSQVWSYPVGVWFSEHANFDNFSVYAGGTAYRTQHGGHVATFTKAAAWDSAVILEAGSSSTFQGVAAPNGALPVRGLIAIENVTAVTWVVNDGASIVSGALDILCGSSITGGYPTFGAGALNLRNVNPAGGVNGVGQANNGWMSQYPDDDFRRINDSATVLGSASLTLHPWQTSSGTLVTSGATGAKCTAQGSLGGWAWMPYNHRGGSRVFTATIATNSTQANIYAGILIDWVPQNGLFVVLDGANNRVSLVKLSAGGVFTHLADGTAGSPGVAASTTYTLTVVATQPQTPGATWTIAAYLGTTLAFTYTMTGTDITNYTEPAQSPASLLKRSGIAIASGSVNDTGTAIKRFTIQQLTA